MTPSEVSRNLQTFDERPVLHRLRRIEAFTLAKRVGLKFPPDATRNDVVQMLEEAQARGVDFRNPDTWQKEKSLEDLSVFELRKVARERGLSVEKTAKKRELLELLNGADPS